MTITKSDLEQKEHNKNTDWEDVISALVKLGFTFKHTKGETIDLALNGDILVLKKDKTWGYIKGNG